MGYKIVMMGYVRDKGDARRGRYREIRVEEGGVRSKSSGHMKNWRK